MGRSIEGYNVRDFDADRAREHIESLVGNIAENGVLTPLVCRKQEIGKNKNGAPVFKYVIVDGECRLRAVQLINQTAGFANITRVPVILEKAHNNEADRLLDMLSGNESLRFSPVELGTAYKRFKNFGWSEEKIANRLGKSIKHVKTCVSLLDIDIERISRDLRR